MAGVSVRLLSVGVAVDSMPSAKLASMAMLAQGGSIKTANNSAVTFHNTQRTLPRYNTTQTERKRPSQAKPSQAEAASEERNLNQPESRPRHAPTRLSMRRGRPQTKLCIPRHSSGGSLTRQTMLLRL